MEEWPEHLDDYQKISAGQKLQRLKEMKDFFLRFPPKEKPNPPKKGSRR